MKYRQEIDGLRAFAVLPVILFHAGFETFSGGFVGVDVFFVISGYLITTIIISELAEKKFSLVEFYERRTRRILPVLFFIMLVCVPFSWVLLPPSQLISFFKSLVAVPLFISNFFFWQEGGYFDVAAELKPLLHTWSLAVEEQFYVFFPLFLTLFWRFGKYWIQIACLIIFFLSLFLAHWASIEKPTAAFFLLPTRGWELLIGTFAAFYLAQKRSEYLSKHVKELVGFLGLCLVLISVFVFSKETPFPSLYTLVPTLGALLIILFATSDTHVGQFIGHKIFVAIGLVSYSAYLWHHPIFAFYKFYQEKLGDFDKLLIVLFVFVLSYVTWKFIEQPFRQKGKFSRRFLFIGALFGGAFFIVFGLLMSKLKFDREHLMADTLSQSVAIYASNFNERTFVKSRVYYENNSPNLIVLGSSRMMQVSQKLMSQNMLNLSVSGATVEDLIAVWFLVSNKFKPETVLIGLDPWLINGNISEKGTNWMHLGAEYISGLRQLELDFTGTLPSQDEKSVVNEFLVELYDSMNISKIQAKDDLPEIFDKVRRDGSYVYNMAFASKPQNYVDRGAPNYVSYAMANYVYSEEARNTIERFAFELKKRHKVYFVLSPYHPKLYDLMKNKNQKFLEIEEEYRRLSKKIGITLLGSYDPQRVGCNANEFYDGMHPKAGCMKKVLNTEFEPKF